CASLHVMTSSSLLPASSFRCFFSTLRPAPRSTLFPYTTLFRSFYSQPYHYLLISKKQRSFVKRQNENSTLRGTLQRVCRHQHSRSEEHTSELQSRFDLVCRLLLEKKKRKTMTTTP